MEKNKTQIIILGALAVTILMNFQRVLLVLAAQDKFTELFGFTIEAIVLRVIIFFIYAYLLLSFNIIWKDKWEVSRFVSFTINLGLFVLTVIVTTRLMAYLLTNSLEKGQIFIVTFTNFLIVHPILLLLASFIKLSFQQQQIILEKEQAKQSALQHQLEALRSQINPHFLFNALNSLTVLIRNESDRALPFVDQLSWLLRATLLRSEDDFISIQHELEYLESYIFLQKERFGEKFKVDVQIPENWKKELIPSFSLQLLAENAIKHNVVSTNQPLLLDIYPNGEYLIIRNQIHKRRDATEGTGLGLLNLSVRFKLLKKRDIQINQDENYFTVKLPILKNESYNH
ncbi:MAG: histidine kinase [Lewinellaceae bacterium]|nr:histidine kinase [Saprospiraceae bacterium]MCB9340025.1 histidine kinase [Lewinellaceae bacterium]